MVLLQDCSHKALCNQNKDKILLYTETDAPLYVAKIPNFFDI